MSKLIKFQIFVYVDIYSMFLLINYSIFDTVIVFWYQLVYDNENWRVITLWTMSYYEEYTMTFSVMY